LAGHEVLVRGAARRPFRHAPVRGRHEPWTASRRLAGGGDRPELLYLLQAGSMAAPERGPIGGPVPKLASPGQANLVARPLACSTSTLGSDAPTGLASAIEIFAAGGTDRISAQEQSGQEQQAQPRCRYSAKQGTATQLPVIS